MALDHVGEALPKEPLGEEMQRRSEGCLRHYMKSLNANFLSSTSRATPAGTISTVHEPVIWVKHGKVESETRMETHFKVVADYILAMNCIKIRFYTFKNALSCPYGRENVMKCPLG